MDKAMMPVNSAGSPIGRSNTQSRKSETDAQMTSLLEARTCILLLFPALILFVGGCGGSKSSSGSGNNPPPPTTNSTTYTAWGDSLTAGCEDGTSPACAYPYQLGKLIGSTVDNEGIGGQTSTEIAVRMGAVATNVTNAFTIPASGAVSGVTFKTGYTPCRNMGAANSVEGTIDGVQVYCQDAGGGQYTLTRVSAGSAVSVSAGDAWTPVLASGALSGMNIIWAGRNNTSTCPTSGVTTANCPVASDIAAMTAYITAHGGRFLVLTVINGELDGYAPSSGYYWVTAINSWITATYPNNSLDIRQALVAAYDPTDPADVMSHTHDVVPFSLRAIDAKGTLRAAVTSSTTCAISFGQNVPATYIVILGSELIYINDGSDGNYDCTRGYAGSTATSYPGGTIWVGVDPLHLSGSGTLNTSNPKGPGYTLVAKLVQGALAKQ